MVWPRVPGLQTKQRLAEANHKNKLKDTRQCQTPAILTAKETGCVARPTLTFNIPACQKQWPEEEAKGTVLLAPCTPVQLSRLPHRGNDYFGNASKLYSVHSSA